MLAVTAGEATGKYIEDRLGPFVASWGVLVGSKKSRDQGVVDRQADHANLARPSPVVDELLQI